MPEVSPDNQPTSVSPSPRTKKPINWKRIGIIAIIAAFIIGGLGYAAVVLNVFDSQKEPQIESPKKQIATPSATPTKKKVLPNEKLIIGDCTKDICALHQVSTNGKAADYPNTYNFKKDSQVIFSLEGENLVYVEGGQLVIVNLVEGTSKKISAKGVSLIKAVGNSFWVEDNGVYKLYDYTGKVTFDFNKSKLKPKYGFTDIDLSNYLNRSMLTVVSRGAEGGFFRELWKISKNQEPKKVADLNFNVSGTESFTAFTFFNKEGALLAVAQFDNGYNVYKLSAAGQKTKLFKVTKTDINLPLLSRDDSTLYYSGGAGAYKQSDVAGLYKVDLSTKVKSQIIKGNNYNASQQSFHSYNLESISPSSKYIALFDAVVSAIKSTTYTPAVLSLNDSSLAKVSGHTANINSMRKVFGWIRTE